MTEQRFWLVPLDYYGEQRFVRDNSLVGEKSLSNEEVVDLLNNQEERIKELEKENRGLQFKIIDMLDFVKEKGTVTREEIKKWWNGDVE